MKTTKKLFKTLLMSLMLVSCLGANAMAEENQPETGNMEIQMNLDSAFTWQIPATVEVTKSDLKESNAYEVDFDVSINSVTIGKSEEVQLTIQKERNSRYISSEKSFYMSDVDLNNSNTIPYYIRETGSEENIGINEILLSGTALRFSTDSSPLTKTLKVVIPQSMNMSFAGKYRSFIVFQAQVINKSA